jgi:hypothetical protein
MSAIPNQLNITIRTSIPGFQKVSYKPSMSLDNISADDSSVRFNPLIKLDKSIIDKIPENLRIKEFFNKNLFESLLVYTNKKPAKTLTLATRYGYVDNNIKVTLQTIFPEGSVIKIGKKPYAIADMQWTTGDWKIDIKQKREELNLNKITDPYLYTTIVKENIISGEEQLKELNEELVYGANFTGARGIPIVATVAPSPASTPSAAVPTPAAIPATTPAATPAAPSAAPSVAPSVAPSALILAPVTTIVPNRQQLLLPPPPDTSITQQPQTQQLLAIEPQIDSERIEEVNEEDYMPTPGIKLVANKRQIQFVRDFFRGYYYDLLNKLYQAFTNNIKYEINQVLYYTTRTNVNIDPNSPNKSISKDAYKYIVDGLRIEENSGGGDCFFIAVSQGINVYNSNPSNSTNKITSNEFGISKIFTQEYLRRLVGMYIYESNDLDDLINYGINSATELNNKYNSFLLIRDKSLPINYLDEAKRIYRENDNFLVEFPSSINESQPQNPFKAVNKNESSIINYTLNSNYWAGQETILALITKLKLNVLVIDKVSNNTDPENTYDSLRIYPFDTLNKQHNNGWDKYLFLYAHENHYELITFKYANVEVTTQGRKIINGETTISIFNRGSINQSPDLLPPIYIIFLIYATYYRTLRSDNKREFALFEYSHFMMLIDECIQRIIDRHDDVFISIYNLLFPFYSIRQQSMLQIGGYSPQYRYQSQQPYRYNPYRYPTQYLKPVQQSMVKKNNDYDTSKLAYSITIDMELYPGTKIPEDQLKKLKCTSKWNAVRKAWADFTGKPYIIKPVYSMLENKQINNKSNSKYNKYPNNKTNNKYNKNPNNNTKKIYNNNNNNNNNNRTYKNYKVR